MIMSSFIKNGDYDITMLCVSVCVLTCRHLTSKIFLTSYAIITSDGMDVTESETTLQMVSCFDLQTAQTWRKTKF
jgi:hypothetical protein